MDLPIQPFLQYTPELEVFACHLETDLNYVTTLLQLTPLSKVAETFRGKMWQLFGFIDIYRYIIPAALSPRQEALY